MNNTERVLRKMADWMTMKGRDWKTIRDYSNVVRNYAKWLAGESGLASLTSEKKVEAWLTRRAKSGCSASTQGVDFNALRCFYHRGLDVELQGIDALRATRPKTIRRAPSMDEVRAILPKVPNLYGYPCGLVCSWIYGSGLRVSEPLNARIKDVDFEHSQFVVRDGKHGVSRRVPIPCSLIGRIKAQVEIARLVHKQDAANGVPVPLPGLLAKKYPKAQFDWAWAWLFPAKAPCRFEAGGFAGPVRWRIHESAIQRAFKAGVVASGVASDLTPHHLRHAWATHTARRGGVTLRDVQVALGHKNLETTAGYVTEEIERIPDALAALGGAIL